MEGYEMTGLAANFFLILSLHKEKAFKETNLPVDK